MFADGGTVGVAVSGGADSVATLHALVELLPGRDLAVVHVDHGLRGDASDADAQFVRELSEDLGLALHLHRCELDEDPRGGLEAAARRARYAYFQRLVDCGACTSIATGHTRSDQAETVLLRLFRGSAGAGLSGILPTLASGVVRPLLDVSRDDVLAFLRERGLAWREDASNRDHRFARNRMRHELLPALRKRWNPNIDAVLARVADWAVEEERFWTDRVEKLLDRHARAEAGGLALDVRGCRELAPAEQRRLVAAAVQRVAPLSARAFERIESVRELLLAPKGTGGVDLPGLRVERSFDLVLLRRPKAEVGLDYDLPLPVPGQVALPHDVDSLVSARLLPPADKVETYNEGQLAFVDFDAVDGDLRLRNWRAGDRFHPSERASETKIKDLFQKRRIASWSRVGWPVVTVARPGGPDRIVWTREFGVARAFAAREGARLALALNERRVSESAAPAS